MERSRHVRDRRENSERKALGQAQEAQMCLSNDKEGNVAGAQ